MSGLRRGIDRVLAGALIVLMAAAVINVLWQVITRWVLDNPSSYTEELARYLLIWIGLLGSAYAAGKKLHLAIDLVPSKLEGRSRHVIEVVIQLFIFLFAMSVMVVGGIRLMSLAIMMGQVSAALGISLGYVYVVLPLSGLLIAFYSVDAIYERVQAYRGKDADLRAADRSSQLPID